MLGVGFEQAGPCFQVQTLRLKNCDNHLFGVGREGGGYLSCGGIFPGGRGEGAWSCDHKHTRGLAGFLVPPYSLVLLAR